MHSAALSRNNYRGTCKQFSVLILSTVLTPPSIIIYSCVSYLGLPPITPYLLYLGELEEKQKFEHEIFINNQGST